MVLTLGAGGSFPTFLADAGEGVTVDHTGASVLTWVEQTAAVLGCKGATREVRMLWTEQINTSATTTRLPHLKWTRYILKYYQAQHFPRLDPTKFPIKELEPTVRQIWYFLHQRNLQKCSSQNLMRLFYRLCYLKRIAANTLTERERDFSLWARMIECEQCFPPILQSNFFLVYILNHKTVSEYLRGFQTEGAWKISVKKKALKR